MAIQLLGADGASIAEVGATHKAQRVSLRPTEAIAWHSIGAISGALTAAAAGGAVFSLRNLSSNLLLIRRVGVGFITTTAFTTPQMVQYGLMVARNFTVSDSGGTAISLISNNTKYRTTLALPTSIDCRIATTAALTAGTKTLDTNTLAVQGGFSGAVGVTLAPAQDNLLQHTPGDYPLVLGQNEGINIQNLLLMGAAGVGSFFVNLEFAEVASF
jgi:hypothetical protein